MNTPSQNQPLLKCHEVCKTYNGINVVDHVSFEMRRGELLSVLGSSGCGKTTLLHLISGFLNVDYGKIALDGTCASSKSTTIAPEKRKIGIVFQDLALFPHMNVSDNIGYGLHGQSSDKRKRITQMLELIGLPHASKKMPHELSGGEQQRVALARSLAPSPRMILLDEPFSNLDQKLRVQLRHEVRDILQNEKTSAIFVTHDQHDSFAFAERILLLQRGRLIQEGSPASIYHTPCNAWVASFIGESNFLPFESVRNLLRETSESPQIPESSTLVMIRPEHWQLDKVKDESRADGTIQKIIFAGEHQILQISLASKHQVNVSLPSIQEWKPSEKIRMKTSNYLFFKDGDEVTT